MPAGGQAITQSSSAPGKAKFFWGAGDVGLTAVRQVGASGAWTPSACARRSLARAWIIDVVAYPTPPFRCAAAARTAHARRDLVRVRIALPPSPILTVPTLPEDVVFNIIDNCGATAHHATRTSVGTRCAPPAFAPASSSRRNVALRG